MLSRRGFTLVELLIGIVAFGIVALAIMRVMNGVLNATRSHVAVAANQANVRTGLLALPGELREVGYDSVPANGAVDSDLLAIAAHRVAFRAMRGYGTTCGIPTGTEFRIRRPTVGLREPKLSDGFLLFVDFDQNLAADDEWLAMQVTDIDPNSTCGPGVPAIKLTLSTTPRVMTGTGLRNIQPSDYWVGGPVRWYERVEYGPYTDPATGLAWLGVRSLSLGQPSLTPVFGPLPDTLAFSLEYRGSNLSLLDPATSLPIEVRAIGVSLTGTTATPVSLAGSTRRSRVPTTFTTLVALRNTLRP